ncbi:MAG: DUF6152 family protein [Burkholderiales bacterium]
MKKLAVVACVLFVATATFAHHGWSEYDTNTPLTLLGEIAEFGYEHPHTFIRLVTAEKTWLAVLAPPSRMSMRGLGRGSLKAGDRVTLIGHPSRVNAGEMRANQIVVDGKTVDFR